MGPRVYLAASLCLLLLSGCGGGGSGTREAPPPSPLPPPPPAPATCQDRSALNYGGSLPCRFHNEDHHLGPTGVDQAHAQGVTGEGVRVGMMDTPLVESDYPTLAGQIAYYRVHAGASTDPEIRYGHGNSVAALLAGLPSHTFPGGVAPGIELYWAAVCHPGCLTEWHIAGVADLANQGVRIISASIGFGPPGDTSLIETWRTAYRTVIDNDILMVWAAGNDGQAQPQPMAALPQYAPEYLDNWIAVTGVQVDTAGTVTGIHPSANACGDTAQWCISAPMVLRFPSLTDVTTTSVAIGTSLSTPVVSGVAALVAGKYPWMSASNLQTTVLTTATDLGEPGVDPVFGWGMINAAKAIEGPARFVADFHADVSPGHWVFGNAIDGDGGLVKSGSGTLELGRDNTYTGLTWIREGQLVLTGSVAGHVVNDASFLSRGGRIGGDYTAAAGSLTQVEIGTGMSVAGTASLAGALQLLAPPGGSLPGETEQVIHADTVLGAFESVSVGSGFFYNATLDYTDTAVLAHLARISTAEVGSARGLAAPAMAGARQADVLMDHLARSTPDGNDALWQAAQRLAAAPTADHAVASLASLSGEVHGTLRVVGMEHALGDSTQLADRVAQLRHASARHEGLALVTGRSGTLRSGDYAKADVSGHGMMVGVHTAVSDNFRAGLAVSGSRLKGHLERLAGDTRARRTGASAYALRDAGRGYLFGVLGVDQVRVDTQRSILLQDTLEPVSGARRDHVWHGRIEAGWGATPSVTPFAALGALRHRQGSIRETGAGGLGLAAARDDHLVGFGEAGLRFDRRFGSDARVGGRIAGRWLLSGRSAGFRAGFADANGSEFHVAGQDMPAFLGRVGVHVVSAERKGWRFIAEAGTEFTRAAVRDSNVLVGASWSY